MDLKDNQGKNCKKICQIKEFRYKIVPDALETKIGIFNYSNWINESWNWDYYDPIHSFIIEYSIELDKKSKGAQERLKNHRSEEPYKTVRMEYLIMSGMSLVGNVGGMLGLFIGFSFLGISEWIVDGLAKAWALRVKARKIKQKQRSSFI